jgi:hypothetical protein
MVMSCFDHLLQPGAIMLQQQQQQQQESKQQQQKGGFMVPVAESEMGEVLATAATSCTPATAMALSLLSPYNVHQEAAVQQLLSSSRVQAGAGFSAAEGGVELLGLLLVRGKWRELLGGTGEGIGAQPAAVRGLVGVTGRIASGAAGGGSRVQVADVGVLQGFYRLLLMVPAHPLAAAAGLGGARSNSFAGQQQQHEEMSCLLLPLAVSDLVLSGCYSSAAALVARRLRLHPELQTLDSSLLLLDKFLVAVAEAARRGRGSGGGGGTRRGGAGGGGGGGEVLRHCVVLLEGEVGGAAEAAHQHLMRALRGPTDSTGRTAAAAAAAATGP